MMFDFWQQIFKEIALMLLSIFIFAATFSSVDAIKARSDEISLPEYSRLFLLAFGSTVLYHIFYDLCRLSSTDSRSFVMCMLLIIFSEIQDEKFASYCVGVFMSQCIEVLLEQIYGEPRLPLPPRAHPQQRQHANH
eukprot:gene1537-1627_t